MIAEIQEETKVQEATTLEPRRATAADHDAILAMYQSFEPKGACLGLPPRKDPGRWLDGLAAQPNFVIFAGGCVVGHAILCIGGDTGEIAVFVHQDYRGRKLGKRLLRAMVDEARLRGMRRVWGMTEYDNLPMLSLARSFGFVPGKDPREFYLDLPQGGPATKDPVSAT